MKSRTLGQFVSAAILFVVCGCGSEEECTRNDDCAAKQFCNVVTNKCSAVPCLPKSCESLGKSCGPAEDGCGNMLDCGGCQEGYLCSQGQCVPGCVPKSCVQLDIECGMTEDGCGDTLDCGVCQEEYSCNQGQCVQGCAAKSCVELAIECGNTGDGCGNTLDCGDCQVGYSCNQGHCVQDCVPLSCSELGMQCGIWPTGCNTTVDCGACMPGYVCEQGACVHEPDDPPVLILQSHSGQSFTLEWTYTWDGLVSSQDFYQLQESTQGADGSSFSTILETSRGDHSSPYSIDLNRAAGIYYFRVRTWDGGFWTEFSSIVTVEIVSAPAVLRLVNDLTNADAGGNTWSVWNKIYKVWIADSEAALNECTDWSCGRLDSASCSLPGETLMPGGDSKDFDVGMYTDGEYWVFMQVGYWDYFCTSTSCCWQEHATNVLDCAGDCCVLKWANFYVYDHYSDTFAVNASEFLPHASWYQTAFCQ